MKIPYQLDTSSKKYNCPACQQRRFVKYIATDTNQYINDKFGRCDREIKCGYHLKPDGELITQSANQVKQLPVYRIPIHFYNKSLSNYDHNNLFKFLSRLFNQGTALELCSLYRIGTSKKWEGATIFWQISSKGEIGQGKIMLLNSESGKRIKLPYPHISSVHKELGKENQKPDYRFFGEHLIALFPNKPIAIVESEKTALIMAGINAECNWIASGGLSMINTKRMQPFNGRKIIFYPDLGGFEKWQKKADELNKLGYQITVSDLLESKCTEEDRKEGFDIADFFIKPRLLNKEDSETLQKMKEKNSCLQLLIEHFNLTEIKTNRPTSYNH